MSQWLGRLTELAHHCELSAGQDPAQLAFKFNAIGLATNWQLLADDEALERVGRAFERALASARS